MGEYVATKCIQYTSGLYEAREQAFRALGKSLPGSIPYTHQRPLRIKQKYHGWPAIDVLLDVHPHIPKKIWTERFEASRMVLEGIAIHPSQQLCAGQRLVTHTPSFVEPPVGTDLKVVYEDASWVVINKPAPLPMHPSGRFCRNTLSAMLALAWPDMQLRAAHRLDGDTTGLVVLTKNKTVAGATQIQFDRKQVRKGYLAKVQGRPAWQETVCDAPIPKTKASRGRREVATLENAEVGGIGAEQREARTLFRCLKTQTNGDGHEQTILEVTPLTGRTNQIRIHCAALGHPIVGDPGYGEGAKNEGGLVSSTHRLHLHAARLELMHPVHKIRYRFECDPAWLC